MPRVLVLLVAALLGVAGLSGCQTEDRTVIAFLVATDQSPRWASADEPAFAGSVEQQCPDCVYLTSNAGGDADLQADQFVEALDQGADVVVLNAVNREVGEDLAVRADEAGVALVAYDRFVPGADYFVAYDAGAIGRQLGQAVVDRVPPKAKVLVINGPQSDADGVTIKRAVRRVLRAAGIVTVAELDPQTWTAEEAGGWLRSQLEDHPAASIDAIVASNDLQAGGAVAALTQAQVRPSSWPVITGQDADLEAVRRIVLGQQTLTVFKSFPREAQKAAEIAVALATDQPVETAQTAEDVPAVIFQPLVVTIDNLTDAVVRDGIYSLDQICQGPVLEPCRRLGLR